MGPFFFLVLFARTSFFAASHSCAAEDMNESLCYFLDCACTKRLEADVSRVLLAYEMPFHWPSGNIGGLRVHSTWVGQVVKLTPASRLMIGLPPILKDNGRPSSDGVDDFLGFSSGPRLLRLLSHPSARSVVVTWLSVPFSPFLQAWSRIILVADASKAFDCSEKLEHRVGFGANDPADPSWKAGQHNEDVRPSSAKNGKLRCAPRPR
ncbi:hypothetical protein OG21DRAFT_1606353 [Imleria badia]|nr:hypothetical protein OG21DRAFT_1606353 [Imleria badia]